MHIPAISVATLLCSPLVLAAPSYQWFNDQTPISVVDDKLSVPGQNPLNFCADPKGDILKIDSVDLSPNPPVPGQTLTINASGTFSREVGEGSKVQIQVKYGLIRLINQEADLCDQISNVDLECPLEKGKMTLTKQVDLPKEIPPGKYTVLADVYTKEKDRITCLQAEVVFSL
ncbi:Phosphatidylglycerol/phosphatidylinositol transfer protein [Emmonsiellopsis sp. PD_33]|nr:Phosphatidylglycerol/phosphatidylinositol transfer protein [Emmonsiellopsis sp. PD_33]